MPSDKTYLNIEELLEDFTSASPRKKRTFVELIDERADDLAVLGSNLLTSFDPNGDDWSVGWILQVIQKRQSGLLENILPDSSGWFTAPSSGGIDYGDLQHNLLEQNFEEADRLTSSFLRELAGEGAEARGYVYFSEVSNISELDLTTIDRLWIAYSQGRFGFSVQARLLASLGGRYDKLWPRIGWKKGGEWTRYPNSFDWSLAAPEGHMPLINQLRGVRLIDAYLNHPAIKGRS